MLIGLAAKNAILIVEFAKARREEGADAVTAALEGAKVRLRPILMTSFAFIFGCLPLWIATGAGAASRRILGTVVISGMLAATLLAIFLIPMLYVQVERLAAWRSAAHAPLAPAPESERAMTTVRAAARSVLIGAVAARSHRLHRSGPDYERPALTPPAAIRGAEARAGRRLAGRRRLGRRVPGRRAAGADPRGAGAERRRPHRGRPRAAGRGRPRRHPGRRLSHRRRRACRPAAAASPPTDSAAARTGAASASARGPAWEIDFWGRFRRATEVGAGAAAGQRVGPARGAASVVSAGRAGLLRAARRSTCSWTSRRRTLASRQESLAADAGARARRRHLARRRARGGAARLRRRRDDRRARAPHRAAGEPDLAS